MAESGVVLDLSDSVYAESAVIDMLKPGTDTPTGWQIELAGPAHAKTIAAGDKLARDRLEKEKAIEVAQVTGRKYKPEEETLEGRKKRNVGFIVSRIIGWSPNPTFKFFSDEAVAFSEDAALKLFLHPKMGAFVGQISDYLVSEKAFT